MEKGTKNKTATAKQVAYIKVLKRDLGHKKPEIADDLTVEQASKLIDHLLNKLGQRENGGLVKRKGLINEPRLGMAMKEWFRFWRKNGYDVWEKKRTEFTKDVIRTYELFTEIAAVVERRRMKEKTKG